MTATKEQLVRAMTPLTAICDAIRELGQVPEGHIYAQVMGVMSLEQFDRIISTLERANLVRRDSSHLLHWTGPALEKGQE